MIAYIGASHNIGKRHVLDTVKHIPDTRPKRGLRSAAFRYAGIVIVILLGVTVLVIGYNILQRDNASHTTDTKSAGPDHTQTAATSSSNLPAPVNPGNLTNSQKIATVTVPAARLREWPTVKAEIARVVPEGESFEVTDEWTTSDGTKWYRVRIPDGREYWIASYIVSVSSSLSKPH
jgi:hypothetical protein